MDADAILAAIRGVLLGDLGSVRTIAADTFIDAAVGNDTARAARANTKPTFDIELGPARRTNDVGPPDAAQAMLSVPIRITLTYPLVATNDAADGTERRRVRALAAEHARDVEAALGWGRNVEVDGDANATGIIPGGVMPDGAAFVKREDWAAGVYEVVLPFRARVLETRAVA